MPNRNVDKVYLEIADVIGSMSYAKRSKVGAVLVRDGRIVSTGYNGTPVGMDNNCEEVVPLREGESTTVTRPEVIHAEMNAILFAARTGQSTKGCTLYLNLSPCMECSKAILQSGIDKVVYQKSYRDQSGPEMLKAHGVRVVQLKSY